MMRLCLLVMGLVFFISCGNKDEMATGVLKPAKMQAVLWDVIRADAYTNDFIKKDSSKNAVAENLKLQQQIFAIHKISKEDFYTSYDYYKLNTKLFKTMLDSMLIIAERNKYITTKPRQAD